MREICSKLTILKPGRDVRSKAYFLVHFLYNNKFCMTDTRYNSDLKHYHVFIYMVTRIIMLVTTSEFQVEMFLRVRNTPLFLFD